jgi:5-methyltetrahydropteroyltriglutamate--homocysteine methyltransferase
LLHLDIHLQIDEPVMVRFPKKALSYGIDDLAKCFAGVSNNTTKVVHLCCGYPLYLVS